METDSEIQRTDWWLPEGRCFEGLSGKGKGVQKYRFVVTKQAGGKCSIGHTVSNIVITTYGAGWVLEMAGDNL